MSAPAKPVSVREFARLDGCDEGLVRRAIKSGKLPVLSDGKLDPALAKTGWRRANRRADSGADKRADTAKKSAPGVRTPRVSAPADNEEPDALDDIADAQSDDFLAGVLRGEFATTMLAEQIKENGLAAKHLIAARVSAGQLVEVERAEAILFEQARAARDAWLGFPTRIGPLLAADLDVDTDRVVEALTIHVQQQLEQLGEPEADFAAQE